MQFEYDPERLIEEVKKRSALWDYNHDQYRSKEAKHKLWCEIIHEMLQSDAEVKMSKSQKRELELQLQKKWKSLRDCYQKYIQNPNRTRRPYIYYKQLRFLTEKGKSSDEMEPVPVQVEIESTDKNEADSDTDEDSHMWKKKKVFKLKSEDTSEDDNDTSMIDYTETDTYLNCSENELQVPNKVRRVTNQTAEFAFASIDSRESDDTDRMFLLSLLPHLKAIPEQRRLEAKMNMMKVLKNA